MTLDSSIALRLAEVCQATNKFRGGSDELPIAHSGGMLPLNQKLISDSRSIPTSTCAILEYESDIVVSFQGTITDFARDGDFSWESMIDWAYNIDKARVDASREGIAGEVHRGFLRQLNLIYPDVEATIRAASDKPLLVTGHSQGGAIALLAVCKLESSQVNVKSVHTYGAPRAGDKTFASSIQAPVYRAEYGADLVPHVPGTFENTRHWISGGLSAISGLFSRSRRASNLLSSLQDSVESNGYSSCGALIYRPQTGENIMNLNAGDESELYRKRRSELKSAGKALASDHGLPNYIAMFS